MIAFRVDANEHIATGHLMRCISIATEWIRRGEDCLFFLAEDKETARLRTLGIPYRILHTDWRSMDAELPVFLPLLSNCHPRWVIVDSYQATASYLGAVNEITPVLYVDDMAAEHYPVSALLHYGCWPEDEEYTGQYRHCNVKLLTGMMYTPLRAEFQPLPTPPSRKQSILITTGGTDPFHITRQLVQRILSIAAPTDDTKPGEAFLASCTLEVILGSMNPDANVLCHLASENPRLHIHQNISNMSQYMRTCTAAVSAGGTTIFELCACKIPTVCFSFADNQKDFVAQMGARGVMLCAGDARDADVPAAIYQHLCTLLSDETLRSRCAKRMGRLVDGNGVQRIVDALSESAYFSN